MASEAEFAKGENGREVGSVLAVDCGSVFTRAILVEQVEGSYRLVACGEALTRAASGDDVVSGARRAIGRVTEITGRALLNERGFPMTPERADGTGADAVVVTLSAAPPLRVWLAGLVEEQSLASGFRACQTPYVVVSEVLSLVDSARLNDVGGLASQLQSLRPDAILLVGGSDQGAERPIRKGVEALSLASLALSESARPVLLYAGNRNLQSLVEEVAGKVLTVRVVDNVRPTMEEERLGPAQRALETLYLERAARWDPAVEVLRGWSKHPLQTTARALSHTVRYLARQTRMSVLAVDLGAYAITLASQQGEAFSLSSSPGLGLAGWGSGVADASPSRLVGWLPEEMDREAIEEMVASLAACPSTMAQTPPELLVEQALARDLIGQALQQVGTRPGQSWDLVVGAGGFLAHLPREAQSALILLDALQPVGVTLLALDSTFLGPALGAVAAAAPLAAAQVLEQDAFLKLGTAVSLSGQGREGDLALRLKVRYESGDTLTVEVRAGSLEVVPLPLNERAELELRPGRGFSLGPLQRGRHMRVRADGGVLGVIVDARGRPLHLPAEPEKRRQRVQEWFWALGA